MDKLTLAKPTLVKLTLAQLIMVKQTRKIN